MRKLIVLFSLLIISVSTQAQTRDDFKLFLDKVGFVIQRDTTPFIFSEAECTRMVSGTKYTVDMYIVALFDRNTLVSWSESWNDATYSDVVYDLENNEYLAKSEGVNLWWGTFNSKTFIAVPMFDWRYQHWYININFIKTNKIN